MRHADGSAGDADYGAIGLRYTDYRQPDPSIAALILKALGPAQRVLNVGAGAGSYEPLDRHLTAVEPSESMRAQRPASHPVAIDATAENLPFPDRHFDASIAIFTVHQWSDLAAGLAELRRVTSGPVVIMSCDPDAVEDFWLNEYAPMVLATEARRYPPVTTIAAALGGTHEILPVPIPFDCRDGFNEAYYGRPERLLEPGARTACSAWSFVAPELSATYVANLQAALADGSWDRAYGHFRTEPFFTGSLRLVVSRP